MLSTTKKLFCLAALGLATLGVAQPVARFDRFQEAPISAVTPTGWLHEFLSRQRSGLTGHPKALSFPYDQEWWGDTLQKDGGPEVYWWPYEQTAYYTDGALRLAYLLRDPGLTAREQAVVNNVLDHPQKSGRLGPNLFTLQWPIAVFFRALQADYLATGDPKVLEALHRHFLTYTPHDLASDMRHVINVEGMLWTYGKTGDPKLLELAEAGYAEANRAKVGGELTMDMALSPEPTGIHGVTHMEEAKLPAILYAYTGKPIYLDAALNAMRKVDKFHMLVDGVPSSYENLHGKKPDEGHETCDITDYTWALGYLLMATGDATWADHIERAVFNAGPGAVTKDFHQVQYFSCPNQVIATGTSNHLDFFKGLTWMQYRPSHQVECCVGNVHRFMPNYAARMWMRDQQGGLVAALYGPSVETSGDLTVNESTDYPFGETIDFGFKTKSPVEAPFTFRLPGWCAKPSVSVNGKPYAGELKPGTFVTIRRSFRNGDSIRLRLPMPAKLVKWETGGVAVERGPLLFAYAVPQEVSTDATVYKNMGNKTSPLANFPALSVRPTGPWNYAIVGSPKVVKRNVKGYPFDPATVPVTIRIPARRVKGWALVEGRYTPPLPERFELEGKVETITLVPYGSTLLRVSVFPDGR